MPVLAVDPEELVRLVGQKIPRDELIARIPMMGGAFDGEKDGRLLFEFFPNRPDLLSVEGLARAARAFFDVRPGLQKYEVAPGADVVTVDPSIQQVRPHIGFARVRGVAMTDQLLLDLIDLQERLTTGPGRKRKKVAIGIHDAAPVKGPFTYKAVPADDIKFHPLQGEREMTGHEILTLHDKGRLYRHLVNPKGVPLIVDSGGQVLSMPPIINGQLTALTAESRDLLVDVTGTDERATQGLLSIVVTSLAERGGKIQSVQLLQGKKAKKGRVTPDLSPHENPLKAARVRELLGLDLTPEDLAQCLGRMGHDFTPGASGRGTVASPAWRMDLLHMDDLVEDVGIGYGFERFVPRLPVRAQFGGVHENTKRWRRARTLLQGLGFTEVVTLTITGRQDALERIGAGDVAVVEVSNPATLEQSILRPTLFPGLLALLRANKHRELPQSVFEVGYVAPPVVAGRPPKNQLRAAALRMANRATFAECKGLVEAFLRDSAIEVRIEPGRAPGFIPGRCAVLRAGNGEERGFFGEIHPETVHAFDLGAPVLCFEVVL